MTSQPTPGEVLNDESVRLLLPGDRVQRVCDGVMARVTEAPVGLTVWAEEEASGKTCGGYPTAFTFVSRPQPSGGQDGGGDGGVGWLWHSRGGTLKLTTWHPDTQAETAERLFTHPAPAKATGWPSREDVVGAVHAWIREDAEMAIKLTFDLPTRDKLVNRLLALFPRPEDEGAA